MALCNPQGQSPPSMGVQASAGPQAGPFQAGGQEPLQGLEPAVGGRRRACQCGFSVLPYQMGSATTSPLPVSAILLCSGPLPAI